MRNSAGFWIHRWNGSLDTFVHWGASPLSPESKGLVNRIFEKARLKMWSRHGCDDVSHSCKWVGFIPFSTTKLSISKNFRWAQFFLGTKNAPGFWVAPLNLQRLKRKSIGASSRLLDRCSFQWCSLRFQCVLWEFVFGDGNGENHFVFFTPSAWFAFIVD